MNSPACHAAQNGWNSSATSFCENRIIDTLMTSSVATTARTQGTLYVDYDQIVCLTARRLEYSGTVGHYVVHALPVLPWTGDVIFDNPTPPHEFRTMR